MTQINFTLNQEELQSLIKKAVKGTAAQLIFTAVLNRVMEERRSKYIRASAYERSVLFKRLYNTGGRLELHVPRTRDGKFSPDVFERCQRNERALVATMLEMYISSISTRKVNQVVETLCGKSDSKSFVSSLSKELDPISMAICTT